MFINNVYRRKQLLSIEEAWNLPISAEMSSRQQQQTGVQQPRPGSQSYQKTNYNQVTQQGPPPPYPSPDQPNKRFKTENGDQKGILPNQSSIFLTPQQLQLLNYFQQNASNLTVAQQVK